MDQLCLVLRIAAVEEHWSATRYESVRGTFRTWRDVRIESAMRSKADIVAPLRQSRPTAIMNQGSMQPTSFRGPLLSGHAVNIANELERQAALLTETQF